MSPSSASTSSGAPATARDWNPIAVLQLFVGRLYFRNAAVQVIALAPELVHLVAQRVDVLAARHEVAQGPREVVLELLEHRVHDGHHELHLHEVKSPISAKKALIFDTPQGDEPQMGKIGGVEH
jgi:hypothetical protein